MASSQRKSDSRISCLEQKKSIFVAVLLRTAFTGTTEKKIRIFSLFCLKDQEEALEDGSLSWMSPARQPLFFVVVSIWLSMSWRFYRVGGSAFGQLRHATSGDPKINRIKCLITACYHTCTSHKLLLFFSKDLFYYSAVPHILYIFALLYSMNASALNERIVGGREGEPSREGEVANSAEINW